MSATTNAKLYNCFLIFILCLLTDVLSGAVTRGLRADRKAPDVQRAKFALQGQNDCIGILMLSENEGWPIKGGKRRLKDSRGIGLACPKPLAHLGVHSGHRCAAFKSPYP